MPCFVQRGTLPVQSRCRWPCRWLKDLNTQDTTLASTRLTQGTCRLDSCLSFEYKSQIFYIKPVDIQIWKVEETILVIWVVNFDVTGNGTQVSSVDKRTFRHGPELNAFNANLANDVNYSIVRQGRVASGAVHTGQCSSKIVFNASNSCVLEELCRRRHAKFANIVVVAQLGPRALALSCPVGPRLFKTRMAEAKPRLWLVAWLL